MAGLRLRIYWRVVAVVMIVGMLAALALSPAFAQEGQKVAQVVIAGNNNINRDTIANVIKLAPGADYTKEAVDKDRAAINGTGYFSAVSVRTEETPEGVRVIYDVVENPIVKDIQIVGEGPLSKDTLKALMRTQSGQVLNTSTLNIDIEAIQRKYRDDGYVAYVTEDIGIDRETGVLTIPILVHTVQSIDIVGNKKTKEIVFLREMKSKPGQVFNMKLLREDISRIYNLDILEDIQTPKIEPGADPGKLAISIPVAEKKTGSVSVGLGYSSQSSLVGRAELSETNFRGKGRGLTLLLESAASDSRLGGSYSYELGYSEPWIDDKHTSMSFNIFNKLLYRFASGLGFGGSDANGQTYNERRKGADIGLSRPLSDYTRAFGTLRSENVESTNITSTVGSGLVAQTGDIRSGTFRLANDTRDFQKDPAAGWYKSVSAEIGHADIAKHFLSEVANPSTEVGAPPTITVDNPVPLKGPFEKFQVDVRHYWSKDGKRLAPADKRTVIAARMLVGVGSGSIPFFEQYFAGGSDSIRGYKEDRFWGDRMAVLSLEYRKPVAQSLTGVVFVDYGDAWGGDQSYNLAGFPQHTGFQGQVGAGLGIRVNTPIGNLRLDYGMGSEGARTHFSIGQAF